MARKPTGNPNGCPKKEINWDIFESLCSIQCTQSEIASMLKIHPDTLRDRAVEKYGEGFSEIYKKFSENGKCSLRRYQFLQAKTKPAMAIWLGKQWLGQKDSFDSQMPKNDEVVTKLLETIKAPTLDKKILDLTKANEDLQDQVKSLQKQLQEASKNESSSPGF